MYIYNLLDGSTHRILVSRHNNASCKNYIKYVNRKIWCLITNMCPCREKEGHVLLLFIEQVLKTYTLTRLLLSSYLIKKT